MLWEMFFRGKQPGSAWRVSHCLKRGGVDGLMNEVLAGQTGRSTFAFASHGRGALRL